MAKIPDRYLLVDTWRVIEEGYHPEKSRVSESLFALGNEHQGLRGYFEEGYSGISLMGSYLNGIYEERYHKEPLHYKSIQKRECFMVNTVNWLYTRIEVDGETLDLHRSTFSDFRRELDFRSGELRREFIWQTAQGKRLKVVFARFLSMTTKELGFQRIALTPLNFSGSVSITLGEDFSMLHQNYGKSFWECPISEASAEISAILGVSENIRHRLFAGFRVLSGTRAEAQSLASDQFVGQRFSVALEQGQETHVDRLNVLHTSRCSEQPIQEAWSEGMQQLKGAKLSYQQALDENCAYWRDFWDRSDIVIEGDPLTQQGVRFSIFQLQQTYRGVVPGANIGAKGLTGETYNGNAFWDTEAYCLPFYLFNNPDAAKALIDFRYKTLPEALKRAKDLDCEGACYPIATIDGTESCTLWQHASLQFQPTTAVAYAIAHYANITQDRDFLYGEGAELLIAICRFLASRGQWSGRGNTFGYYGVMGPDEFQVMVNHNCYTNYVAQQTFRFTARVLAEMDASHWDALMAKVACTPSEIADWQHLADHMLIPHDPETGIYEQHEGFFDLPHVDVDAIPVEEFPLYHHWAYDRLFRNDMIKQPDVLMFMFLYNQSFTLAEKQANYAYYEPRCIHESSLSPSVHSILAAELGRHQEAVELFEFATRIDLDNYNRNTHEGIHLTSVAAAWMNIVYGFGGMRSDGEVLLLNPTIPDHWTGYRFQIVYRNARISVIVTRDESCIQLVEGTPVTISVRGDLHEIDQQGIIVGMRDAISTGA